MTLEFDRILAVANIHIHAKFYQARLTVHELSHYLRKKNRKKLSDHEENNTATAMAADSKKCERILVKSSLGLAQGLSDHVLLAIHIDLHTFIKAHSVHINIFLNGC